MLAKTFNALTHFKQHIYLKCNMFKSLHFVPIRQCWQLREDSWEFSFSIPSLQYRRNNNLKENWDGKWVDFFFFLLLFPRCKFYPPTKSKHFCLADKCTRGESKSCIHQDKTTLTNKIEGAMRAKQQKKPHWAHFHCNCHSQKLTRVL